MSKARPVKEGPSYIQLVTVPEGGHHVDAVPIHHGNLDTLVGRLMQMFDLNGDVQQREAQKSSAKMICRDWLDDTYKEVCGYDKWYGEIPGGQTIKLERYTIEYAEKSVDDRG